MKQPKITGIHHIALKCNGVEEYKKTISFYCDILGLTVAREWGEGEESGIMLDTGAGILEIFAKAENEPSVGALHHYALGVEDTEACLEAVCSAGYKITMGLTEISIPSNPPYRAKIGFCIGPVGEELEFFQVL